MVTQAIIAVVTALAIAGIVALFKRRRIFLVSPRLLAHSALSRTGHVLEITVLNRGIASEEEISVSLNPRCEYELLAASTPDVSVDAGNLTIPRLVPEDEFTVILQAEGPNDPEQRILQATSKSSKVRVVDRYENVGPTTCELGVMSAFGVLVLAVLFFVGRDVILPYSEPEEQVASYSRPETPTPDPTIEARIDSYRALGWTVDEDWITSPLSTRYKSGSLPVRVLPSSRRGNLINVPIEFSNQFDGVMKVSARLISPAGEGPEPSTDDILFTLSIYPGTSSKKTLAAYLPREIEQKRLILEVLVHYESKMFNFEYEWSPESA
jgi:hypothetical protein